MYCHFCSTSVYPCMVCLNQDWNSVFVSSPCLTFSVSFKAQKIVLLYLNCSVQSTKFHVPTAQHDTLGNQGYSPNDSFGTRELFPTSALIEHAQNCSHPVDWTNVQMLVTMTTLLARIIHAGSHQHKTYITRCSSTSC